MKFAELREPSLFFIKVGVPTRIDGLDINSYPLLYRNVLSDYVFQAQT